MRLPFHHKEEEIALPIYEVKKLRAEGKSDREIISKLKEMGYSFESIERAMLEVLKEGVKREQPVEKEQEEVARELPTKEELEKPKFSVPERGFPIEPEFEPAELIEEVVEGVVEEKFEKLDMKFEYINKELEKIKKESEHLKNFVVASIEKENRAFEEIKKEFAKLKSEIDELGIKTNALEMAFKQFLPDIFVKIRESKFGEKRNFPESSQD